MWTAPTPCRPTRIGPMRPRATGRPSPLAARRANQTQAQFMESLDLQDWTCIGAMNPVAADVRRRIFVLVHFPPPYVGGYGRSSWGASTYIGRLSGPGVRMTTSQISLTWKRAARMWASALRCMEIAEENRSRFSGISCDIMPHADSRFGKSSRDLR